MTYGLVKAARNRSRRADGRCLSFCGSLLTPRHQNTAVLHGLYEGAGRRPSLRTTREAPLLSYFEGADRQERGRR